MSHGKEGEVEGTEVENEAGELERWFGGEEVEECQNT